MTMIVHDMAQERPVAFADGCSKSRTLLASLATMITVCACIDTFEVYLMQSANLQSSGECLLQVTADSIQLLDIDDPRRVQLSWPLNTIRRYSVERGMFSLEAGRSLCCICCV